MSSENKTLRMVPLGEDTILAIAKGLEQAGYVTLVNHMGEDAGYNPYDGGDGQVPDSGPSDTLVDVDVDHEPKLLLPWGKQILESYGTEFIEGMIWIQNQIGLKPELLASCMKFESDINIRARNPASSASGLIQFMSFTAKNLGTTIEEIRKMDAMTQLSYVYKYFKDFADRGHKLDEWDVADTYMAILWPAGIGKPLDHPIFVQGKGRAYAVNRGLDANRDGFVTKREAANKVIALHEKGMSPSEVLAI